MPAKAKQHGRWGAVSLEDGGDEGDRTLDLGIANAALSQLSYVPGEAKL